MATYSDSSKIITTCIEDRTTLNCLTDGSGVPLRNVRKAYTIVDLTGGVPDAIQIEVLLAGAPTSGSGTQFAKYAMGSKACDMSTGKWYSKTSEVGATDAWVIEN